MQSLSINWSQIDTVFLDMDGTLLDLAFDNWFWQQHLPSAYASHHRLSLTAACGRLFAAMEHHAGTLDWYSLDFWNAETGLDTAALQRAASARIAERPHARALLEHLAAADKRVIMTTNAHPATLAIKLEKTAIAPFFDALVTSHELGAAKESAAFWERLAQRYTFTPARTLLLDDSLPVLEAAQAFGIGHLFSIAQPDSSRPPRHNTAPFPAIDDFSQVLP